MSGKVAPLRPDLTTTLPRGAARVDDLGRVVTRGGVTIGQAYTPPPARIGAEAERVAAATRLAHARRLERIARPIEFGMGILSAAVLVALFVAAALGA